MRFAQLANLMSHKLKPADGPGSVDALPSCERIASVLSLSHLESFRPLLDGPLDFPVNNIFNLKLLSSLLDGSSLLKT